MSFSAAPVFDITRTRFDVLFSMSHQLNVDNAVWNNGSLFALISVCLQNMKKWLLRKDTFCLLLSLKIYKRRRPGFLNAISLKLSLKMSSLLEETN